MSNHYAHSSIYHYLNAVAEQQPEATALRLVTDLKNDFQDLSWSYQELLDNIRRVVRLLRDRSQAERPVCSFLLPNIPQAHAIMWGAETAGVANPLNPLLNEDALVQLMEAADADVLMALGPNPVSDIWQKAEAVAKRLSKPVTLIPVFFPAESYELFEQLLGQYSADALEEDSLPGLDDMASYFHTGGTTGTPKLAQNSQRNQLACVALHHESMNLEAGDVVMSGLPLFHVAGSMINGLSCLCAGIEIILPTIAGFRDPNVVLAHWQMVEKYQVTVSGGIPTSVASMVNVPVDADVSSLKYLISGGSPVPAALCHDVKSILGLELYQIYGMTECAGAIAMPNIHKSTVPGSAGYVSDLIDLRINGAEKAGDSGELLVRGDVVFAGYLGRDENPLNDGWLHTGDLGHIDGEGYLFITGRAKDLIIRSGHNIDPALIENCLEQHPAVSLAAAVGRPDAYAGELPVAYVQLYDGHSVTEQELMTYAVENIAERPACPKFIEILEALPVTAVGKVHKPSLRAAATERTVKELLGDSIEKLPAFDVNILDSGEMALQFQQSLSSELEVIVAKLARELNLKF
ncbi:AMP-binding protein [Pseudoteredinibacter isoporae]|uniref:AMP-binding protein n=1 Tax=Pseudoteredinibacter isoporae TaxID=570281 RepID=UPI003103FD6A